jgi:hypothetical protein
MSGRVLGSTLTDAPGATARARRQPGPVVCDACGRTLCAHAAPGTPQVLVYPMHARADG